jgi:hypothetical protein
MSLIRNQFCCFVLLSLFYSIPSSIAFQNDARLTRMTQTFGTETRRVREPLQMKQDVDFSLSLKSPAPSQNAERALRAGAALFLVGTIILGLAMSESQDSDTFAIAAMANVIDAAMPSSSTDLVAGVLGESIGGVCGATATVFLSSVLNFVRNSTQPMEKSRISDAISDGEYFITMSASKPLLELVGLPPALASISSVVFAAIPSQLVKLSKREKERKVQEDERMKELLEEEKLLRSESKFNFLSLLPRKNQSKLVTVKPEDLTPISSERAIDPVEVFSDVTRWLEYGVLKNEFEGYLLLDGMPLNPGPSGAFFGIVAAVSSQFYADVLYGRLFGYGPKSKKQEVSSRSPSDWAKVYLSRAASSAALFGIYEQSQIPISRYIQGMLAGGVDGCFGSASFDMCLQTYIDTNAPGPSSEAQFRALVINFVMVGQRLQDIASDTTLEDLKSLFGAWLVSVVSYSQQIIPHVFP